MGLTKGQKSLIKNMINNELKNINNTVYCESELIELKQALNIDNVSNLLFCGMCDKETKHEQISSTTLKCLECGNIAVE